MKKLISLLAIAVGLAGCAALKNLTPAQDAQLACLGTAMGAQLAANHTNAIKAAVIQADGTILCTFSTGVSIVVTPTK